MFQVKNQTQDPQLLCLKSLLLTSSTADPTADDIGLPPYVLKWRAEDIVLAISGVVTTAAKGNPLPIPFAMVTEKCMVLFINVLEKICR